MLRNLFNQRHPFLMQALGGLVAVIIFIPIAGWVAVSVLTSKSTNTATPVYAPPSNADQTAVPPANGPKGKGSSGGGESRGGGTNPNGGATVCSTAVCTVKMEAGDGGYIFSPSTLQVKVGTVLHFVNVGGIPHNIVPNPAYHDPAAPINRPTINAQDYTTGKLTVKGTFHYECQVHLPEMVAQVTVVG